MDNNNRTEDKNKNNKDKKYTGSGGTSTIQKETHEQSTDQTNTNVDKADNDDSTKW